MAGEDRDQIQIENRAAQDLAEDRVEPVETRSDAPKQEAPEAPEKKEIPVGSKYQDKRAAIASKFRQSRDRADAENPVEAIDDDRERMRYGRDVETRADREARRREESVDRSVDTPEAPNASVEAPVSRMKLTVHGREMDLPQDEVIALAQQAMAAGNILENAKQFRAEQQRILEELKTAKANQSPDEKKASETAQTGDRADQPSDAEMDEIVDRIQVGNPEEAKAAFEKYGDRILTKFAERIGNIDQHIEQTIRVREENAERRREMVQTLSTFADQNPEFRDSPALQSALATEAATVMRQNMRDIGVRDETLEQLKQQHGFSDQQATAYAYRYLRGKGYVLPDNGNVLAASAERLRTSFGIKRQEQRDEPRDVQRDMQERVERKQSLGPQPRRANASPSAEVRERSREDAQRQAVRQMRMARRGRA